jgi:hypothetical protein
MDNFYPLSFVQAVGGVLCGSALVFSFISLFDGARTHAIRILAVFFVVALSLFANHVTVYFAAVFIIATAVTELEFLQTLAAILRGNKEYFAFKKDTLSDEAKYKNSKLELVELDALSNAEGETGSENETAQQAQVCESSPAVEAVESAQSIKATPSESKVASSGTDIVKSQVEDVIPVREIVNAAQAPEKGGDIENKHWNPRFRLKAHDNLKLAVDRMIRLERKALDYIQSLYGANIERNVVFKSKELSIVLELDGLISRPNTVGYVDQIFEVKYLSNPSKIDNLTKQLPKLAIKSLQYTQITKRQAATQLVVVLDADRDLNDAELDVLRHGINKCSVDGFFVVGSKEIEQVPFIRE